MKNTRKFIVGTNSFLLLEKKGLTASRFAHPGQVREALSHDTPGILQGRPTSLLAHSSGCLNLDSGLFRVVGGSGLCHGFTGREKTGMTFTWVFWSGARLSLKQVRFHASDPMRFEGEQGITRETCVFRTESNCQGIKSRNDGVYAVVSPSVKPLYIAGSRRSFRAISKVPPRQVFD